MPDEAKVETPEVPEVQPEVKPTVPTVEVPPKEEGEKQTPESQIQKQQAAAIKEKNATIQTYKTKLDELNSALEMQKAENELLKALNEPPNETEQKTTGDTTDLEKKIKDLEEYKTKLETDAQSEETKRQVEAINAVCVQLEEKYKDSDTPFDRLKILPSLYNRTGGILNSLDQIDDEYILLKAKNDLSEVQLKQAREKAQTESPSANTVPPEIIPKSIDAAFQMVKSKKIK